MKLYNLIETCGGCPTIYKGYTKKNKEVIFYLRFGCIDIKKNGKTILDVNVSNHGLDGVCSIDDFIKIAKENGINIKIIDKEQ